jgi:ABC-type transport system involved in multi-copper enzyme maturation permease subunit
VKAALRYELMRIRTIRSTWWLTGLAFVVGVALTTLMSWAIWHDFTRHGVEADDLDGLGAVVVTQLAATGELPSLVAFLLAMVGILAWGHEYRHGMIRASLTALRSRTAFWVAKYVVCVAWTVVVALATMLASGLVATAFLHRWVTVFSAQTWGVIGRELVYVVILTCLGMAFTAVTRSQAFALVALFLWPLLVEHLVELIFALVPGLRDHAELTRFLPFAAGNRLVDVLRSADSTFGDPLSPVGGGLVFGAVAVVLGVASFLLFHRRDA